jgi:SAM-dependent methyltransferase
MDGPWSDYYEANEAREPREMLLETLDAFGPGVHEALDLGCGAGIETLAMLERGWTVSASDAEPEAIDRLLARVPAELAPQLTAAVAPMESLALPTCDLVWAGYSLFFCRPERFAGVWSRIRGAVRPRGRFGGQLLGERDTWAPEDDISSFTDGAVRALFDGWTIERFVEEERDGEACSGPKHWHVFHVAARAPGPRP